MAQHFIGVSGGKDSLLTAIRAKRWFERHAVSNQPPRYQACDTDNEEDGWHDYIAYIERALGIQIEILKADFTAQLAHRRANIRDEWSKEKRIRKHSAECKARSVTSTYSKRMAACACPVTVYPPVEDHLIERAIDLLQPSGNSFLDLCMLKGRFPGMMSRFCTEELKIEPLLATRQPLLDAGVNCVSWIGERAQESRARAKKPVIQRTRYSSGASMVLYRPIHGLQVEEVFAEIAAAGIRWNPRYDDGAKRYGCWPCAFCGKDEVQLVQRLTPERIDRLRDWEATVGMVSRRQMASFFHAPDETMQGIDKIVEWSATSRGGKQFDMFQSGRLQAAADAGVICNAFAGECL